MAYTLYVKTSQYTSVLMYHYVGIHEAAECSSGSKSRMLLNNSKGRKLDLAQDDCLRSVSVKAVSLSSMPSPVSREGSAFWDIMKFGTSQQAADRSLPQCIKLALQPLSREISVQCTANKWN